MEKAVPKEKLLDECRHLKKDGFESLLCISGVDYVQYIEVVYHIISYAKNEIAVLKVQLPYNDLTIPTITKIWAGANWHEREVYDLFGVIFKGHPNLKRILLPDHAEWHPMRKSVKHGEKFTHLKLGNREIEVEPHEKFP